MILDRIVADKKAYIARARDERPIDSLQIDARATRRSLIESVLRVAKRRKPAIISETKRRSPSGGEMKCEYTLTELAAMYERAGAAGISVLTDTKYFGGTPADMIEVRKHTTVPVLCKEFIVDEYQIYEAAAHQADAVLLIAAILDDERIARFMRLAHDLGIEVLLESHTKSELERSIASGAKLLGINNRNLDTLATDLDTSFELLGLVPEDRVVISESGIKTSADIRQLISAGAQGFLIGESLLKSGNPEQKLGDLIKAAR